MTTTKPYRIAATDELNASIAAGSFPRAAALAMEAWMTGSAAICMKSRGWRLGQLAAGIALLALAASPSGAGGCDDWNSAAFFSAATADEVRDCLTGGSDPMARDDKGWTPLHMAAALTDDPAVLTALVDAGADPNAPAAKQGATPLHAAVQHSDDPVIVEALLEAGANPNAQTAGGEWTPLHAAAEHASDPAIVAALLNRGADPNARTDDNIAPLMLAARYAGNPAIVAVLLDAGANPNPGTVRGWSVCDLMEHNPALKDTDVDRRLGCR